MKKIFYSVDIKFKVTGDKDKMPNPSTLEKDFKIWIGMWGDKVPLDISEVDVTVT